MSLESFVSDIAAMNLVFETGFNSNPVPVAKSRIVSFHQILRDEVDELLEATESANDLESIVSYADTLGDVVVYCFSEAARHGIPLLDVLSEIMNSMETKLVDGVPLWNADRTKFGKGPDYVSPESAIRQIFVDRGFACHD